MADEINKNQAQKNARAADGKKALADYESQAAALRAKTERLKALRLAKEATEGSATADKIASPKTFTKAPRRSKSKRASGTLSDWLKDQERGGRNT